MIEIERALGLFDADIFANQRSLYPDYWQTDWKHDRSTTLSLVLVGLLALLALVATVFIS